MSCHHAPLPRAVAGAVALACGASGEPIALVVDPPLDTIVISETRQFVAILTDGDGTATVARAVSWASSDEAVASVTARGVVTGRSDGTSTITASLPEISARGYVTVMSLVEGLWSGTSEGVTLTLILSETTGCVSGSAALAEDGVPTPLTVTGTHVHPAFSLTLTAPGSDAMLFAGRFEGHDRMTGHLDGAGFADFAISVDRTYGGEY